VAMAAVAATYAATSAATTDAAPILPQIRPPASALGADNAAVQRLVDEKGRAWC
jgi:hypothetical protein